jgi:hypothetical protein
VAEGELPSTLSGGLVGLQDAEKIKAERTRVERDRAIAQRGYHDVYA